MITIIDINNLFNIIKKSLVETPPYVWTHWCPLYLFNSLVRALFGHKTSSARFGCSLGQLYTVTISNKYIIFSRINNTLHISDILIIHIEIKDMVFTITKTNNYENNDWPHLFHKTITGNQALQKSANFA